jgi:very-short-patch-repair endonuclease
MPAKTRTVEQRIAEIASRSHGVVTRRELTAAGISRAEIEQRLADGSLIREHRGVYRVGHRAPSVEAAYMAAVQACGPEAVLSGRSAAFLHELIRGTPPAPEVTTRTDRRVRGLRTKRSRHVEATRRNGIPVTTVPRTLVDLAAELGEDALARACHEAGVRYRTTPGQVDAVLATRPTTKGAAVLRRVLRGETRVTLSALERRFLEHLRDAGLPLPVTNRPAGGRRVDCRWPEHRLTVELDSYRYHGSRHAWEQDRRREREAHGRGDDFRRFTHADVFEAPGAMLAELRTVISPAWSSR